MPPTVDPGAGRGRIIGADGPWLPHRRLHLERRPARAGSDAGPSRPGGRGRRDCPPDRQYANACNIFVGGDEASHKLNVLRSHCETVGRHYDEIEKTTMINIETSTSQGELLDKLRAGHDLGFTTTYVFARNPEPLAAIELLAGVAVEVGGW